MNISNQIITIAAVLTACTTIIVFVVKLWKNVNRLVANYNKIESLSTGYTAITNTIDVISTDIQSMHDELQYGHKSMDAIQADLENHHKIQQKTDALVLASSRAQLMHLIESAVGRGYDGVENKGIIAELYEQYHNNGGNGSLTALYKIYEALPTTNAYYDISHIKNDEK